MDPQFPHKRLVLSVATVDIQITALWHRGYNYTYLRPSDGTEAELNVSAGCFVYMFSLVFFPLKGISAKLQVFFVCTWCT